jgi:beta-glucosidase
MVIDEAIRGNLYVALMLGALDGPEDYARQPFVQIGVTDTSKPWKNRRSRFCKALNRKIGGTSEKYCRSAFRKPLLPLMRKKIRKVAVIGPGPMRSYWTGTCGLQPLTPCLCCRG